MSHLWNSLIAKLWPLPPGAISLGFSGNSLVAVRAVCEEEGYRITHVVEELLPFSLLNHSAPAKEDCAALSQAMQRLAVVIPQAHWPLQIALPDPVAIFQVMEFDSLPETAHERAAIAQFRFGKEFPTMAQMQCTTQVISKEGEQKLLLALFVQRTWLDCINVACRAAGLVPGVIDISISHLFNRFYDVVKAGSGNGVLISVEPETWSILFWDDAHRPRFVRSRWRDTSADKNKEHEFIVKDVERLIVSYVSRVHGRRVDGVYLCAHEDDRASLAERLDKRMHMPCVQLNMAEQLTVSPGLSLRNIPLGVLAAAVPRI